MVDRSHLLRFSHLQFSSICLQFLFFNFYLIWTNFCTSPESIWSSSRLHDQATTTRTTMATGLGTPLVSSCSGSTGFKMNQTTTTLKSIKEMKMKTLTNFETYSSLSCLAFVPNYNNFGSYNLHWNDLECDDIARYICMKQAHWILILIKKYKSFCIFVPQDFEWRLSFMLPLYSAL